VAGAVPLDVDTWDDYEAVLDTIRPRGYGRAGSRRSGVTT
jgi:hypothetical protein